MPGWTISCAVKSRISRPPARRRRSRGSRRSNYRALDAPAPDGQTRPPMLRSALLNVMIKAAQKAGRTLKRDFGEVEHLQVSLKGPANFVSAADTRPEEILFPHLSPAPPPSGYLR